MWPDGNVDAIRFPSERFSVFGFAPHEPNQLPEAVIPAPSEYDYGGLAFPPGLEIGAVYPPPLPHELGSFAISRNELLVDILKNVVTFDTPHPNCIGVIGDRDHFETWIGNEELVRVDGHEGGHRIVHSWLALLVLFGLVYRDGKSTGWLEQIEIVPDCTSLS